MNDFINALVKIEQIEGGEEQVVTSSRKIAETFGKEHKNVIQSIENIKAENSALTSMFYEITYKAKVNL